MKILSKIILLLLISGNILYAEDNPADKLTVTYPTNHSLPSGGELNIDVKVSVPSGFHIYLGKENKSKLTITDFTIEDAGLQVAKVKRPVGKKLDKETILEGDGTFSLKVFDLVGRKKGDKINTNLLIKTQICQTGKNGICYSPTVLKKQIVIEFNKDKEKKFAVKNSLKADRSPINWLSEKEAALQQAKKENKNVFALMSEPDWCGACRYMEQEAFAKKNVQDMLNSKFVTWKVKDEDYGLLATGSIGLPTYFVLDSSGKSLVKEVGGRDADGLIAVIQPYIKGDSKPTPPPEENNIPLPPNPEPVPDVPSSDLEPILPEFTEVFGGGEGIRYTVKEVSLNGGGNTITVEKGTKKVELKMKLLHNCESCGGAINQVIVGLSGEERAQACAWNGQQKSRGWVKVKYNLKLPKNPGVYYIRTRYAQGNSCAGAYGWWKVDRPNGPDSSSNIGAIIVK
ncbi:MAG: thioredoxin family protein [Leptospiraceae bacterium]|nr:thioredoxin family protein [Leptospiraceae bacterium]MBP9162471.1 thioredoxin family protein [Leptospiraceae bacterium]